MSDPQEIENTDAEIPAFFSEFKHLDEFMCYLDEVEIAVTDIRKEERLHCALSIIFCWYQEQPHLLDPFLGKMLGKCIDIINKSSENPKVQHFIFKVIHLMTKTRGYKNLTRLMPHTVDDLEPVFELLHFQDLDDRENWQTRYVLLLWLSIVVMVPFGLDKLEKPGKAPLTERIISESKRHIVLDEVTQEAAAYLLARFISRPDVYSTELGQVFDWVKQELKESNYGTHKGQMRAAGCLRSLGNICKIVPRTVLLPHAPNLLQMILNLPADISNNILLTRLRTKLIQRVGLVFCPRRSAAASWRYQRGFRSLADNLVARIPGTNNASNGSCGGDQLSNGDGEVQSYLTAQKEEVEEGEDFDVPDEVAEIIDNLIDALRSKFTIIRWSAAKGLGRICSRLTAPFVDDVLTAILSLCTRMETFSAWHGACFALAELGRRCLLLPEKLNEVIPVVLTALFYDFKSGDCNYGANVRDAACYCCWAFARAYKASDFSQHVRTVSQKLILVTLFDRELNVRRAAAAAFQENVGRQDQFAHGIEIITTCDYFAVGNQSNCYLNLSVFVAGFKEYTPVIVEHLALLKLGHWDENIRDLSAQAIFKLTRLAKVQMQESILPQLIENTMSTDLYMRQGSILGIAELILALTNENALPPSVVNDVREILPKLEERKYFRGVTGELMRRACCRLIEKVSIAQLPLHEDDILEKWRIFLDECFAHREATVRDPAIPAYAAFLKTYIYRKDATLITDYRDMLLSHLLANLQAKTESIQIGFANVLGEAPGELFHGAVDNALSEMFVCCRGNPQTVSWGNARQNALSAVVKLVSHIGVNSGKITDDQLRSLYPVLNNSLADYTVDSRGDIGSVVRESGMKGILSFTSNLVKEGRADVIEADTMEHVFVNIAQQAVEKIDRTRAVAAQVFVSLLNHEPEIPHIPHRDSLRQIFTDEKCTDVSWLAADVVFPLFVQLFDFPEFHYQLVLGFSVSVGGVTEKTVRGSSDALRDSFCQHESDPEFVLHFMKTIVRTFASLSDHARICLQLLKFLDFLLCDPVVAATLENNLTIVEQLLSSTWTEIHRSKEVAKLNAAIDIYGAMLQFQDPVRKEAAGFLINGLRHRYPVIRKTAAAKLFECLLIYDIVDQDVNEKISELLSETVWEHPLTEVRPIQQQICELMNIDDARPEVKSPV